jgi:hypothetical protein
VLSISAVNGFWAMVRQATVVDGKLMKVLERLHSTGIVTDSDGIEMRAKYDLEITQDEPESGEGIPQVAGFKHVSGQVWSTCDPYFVLDHSRKIMTLQMEDGRKLRFFHRGIDGSIGLNKWIG